jgi:hypothetical protein
MSAAPVLRLRRASVVAFAAFALFGAAARAAPQVVVDAGPDQVVPNATTSVSLAGAITNPTPMNFWIADGDHASENRIVKFDDVAGISIVGPLKTAGGTIYGWPADFERIGLFDYGIDAFFGQLYTYDPSTAIVSPIGGGTSYSRLFGLAYDSAADILYSVDQATRKVLKFNRTTGNATTVGTLPSAHSDVHGLAFRTANGLLYYCDDATEGLYTFDPATKVSNLVLALNDGPSALFDELHFFHDRLFASFRTWNGSTGLWSMELAEIDLSQLFVDLTGRRIDDCSAHSLMVNSVPDHVTWTQISGPVAATFSDPEDLQATVTLPKGGTYVFELRSENVARPPIVDQVTIIRQYNVPRPPPPPPPPPPRNSAPTTGQVPPPPLSPVGT